MSGYHNNYRGGGGGGGGHRGGRGRGGGRGGRGGRGGGGSPTILQAKFRPCKSWLTSGNCTNHNCQYAHIVQLHATVPASSMIQSQQGSNQYNNNKNYNNNANNMAAISDIGIWETNGQIKIFTGSTDGYWRLWNTSNNFAKEFETKVGEKVDCLLMSHTFLFCGMQAYTVMAPDVAVGMVQVWNLQQPTNPPLELHLSTPFAPYAHNQTVTAMCVHETSVVTGSMDGSVRIWKFVNNAFALEHTLFGHAREVTGLVVLPDAGTGLIWSSSSDGTIRIWDKTTGACQYNISKQLQPQQGQPTPPQAQQATGHSDAVTALETFHSPAGTFVLSGSLDGTVKAWNGTTGECVASESHSGDGVVSLAIAEFQQQQVLLVGLVSGNLVCRNLVQTPKVAAFEPLFVLNSKFNVAHNGSVKCITPGPQGTFYSGGSDGSLMVWQINGDLGFK